MRRHHQHHKKIKHASSTGQMALISAPRNCELILNRIEAGRRMTHRLTELGFTPGVRFSILHDSGGPILLSVRGSRVAIGRGMACRMYVESTSETKDS